MIDDRGIVHAGSQRLALLRSRVAVVFERLPMLTGFHVAQDLSLAEITVEGWCDSIALSQLDDEICAVLEEFAADDAAGTAELLRGRTFARAVH